MRMILLYSVFCGLLITAPALSWADDSASGLKYTTFDKPRTAQQNAAPADPASPTLRVKQISPEQGHLLPAAKPEQGEISRVWEKYKVLAAGKAEEDDTAGSAPMDEAEDAPPATQADMPPQSATEEQPPLSAGGIAGLLSQYRQNKQDGGRMKTIIITPDAPARPAVPAPDAPASKTAKQ